MKRMVLMAVMAFAALSAAAAPDGTFSVQVSVSGMS